MALEARTDMVAPAIDMNLAPFLHAAVLALVWKSVVLVGQIMTAAESIAATTGSGGSSPGRVRGFIVILLVSMPSREAAAIIVVAIAGSVAESVTMRTCSPGFALAQVRSRFTAPLNPLRIILKDLDYHVS
jgi:hypothetical protein